MIRVGFVLPEREMQWLGGANYYRNLLTAICSYGDGAVLPVVLTGSHQFDKIEGMEIVRVGWLRSSGFAARLWRLASCCGFVREAVVARALRRLDIRVLSHWGPVRFGRGMKTIGWIPDFQHVHLPGFFSAAEKFLRNRIYKNICHRCDHVVVSSEAAWRDLVAFSPAVRSKASVLRFRPEVDIASAGRTLLDLQRQYAFAAPYFFLPNQFWVHKNHEVVISALALLRDWGIDAVVVATGNTRDHRNARHFGSLLSRVSQLRLQPQFRVLGVVPYADLCDLMRYSVAVINPSLFEGWSTTVEEANAIGKTIILSDLAVHREQEPDAGLYFEPADFHRLAELMAECLRTSAGAATRTDGDRARHEARRREFAHAYVDIVRRLARTSDSGVDTGTLPHQTDRAR